MEAALIQGLGMQVAVTALEGFRDKELQINDIGVI